MNAPQGLHSGTKFEFVITSTFTYKTRQTRMSTQRTKSISCRTDNQTRDFVTEDVLDCPAGVPQPSGQALNPASRTQFLPDQPETSARQN